MNAKILANGILRAVAILVSVALFLYFLYGIQSVLIYLVSALILTLIGNPILDFFKRRLKFKHIFATIATLLLFLLTIAGILMLFVPLIISQGENLSLLNTSEIEKNSIELIGKISVFLENHNIDSAKMLKEFNITSKLNFDFIPNLLNTIVNTVSSFGMGLASVLFITFFFLKDKALFIEGVKKLIQEHKNGK